MSEISQHREIMDRLNEMELQFDTRIDALEKRLDPIYKIYSSVDGFNKISIWLLKFLAAIGAGIVGLLALLELFKKISK